MKVFTTSFRDKLRRMDPVIWVCTVVLISFSLLTLYGGREYFTVRRVIIQLFAALLGFASMTLITTLDYQVIVEKLYVALFILSVGALAVVLVFGTTEGGNKGWLSFENLPVNIQPSEFVKITLILTFSKHLDVVKDRINKPRSVIGLMLHAGIIIVLVLLSGDLGVALVYIAVIAFMLYAAGLSLWYFVAAIALAVILFPYIWPHLGEYQQERILYGFNPELDPLDKGYQPLLSKSAIAAGGFFGRGLNGGSVYPKLPAARNDFIFAVICEKFGFLGAFFYIAVLLVLVFRILYIARISRKDYGSYICVGIAAVIIVQTVENIGMCLAMMPVVGITLPFMSYGGSSVLSLMMMMGIVQSVRAYRIKYFFEREST